MTLGKLHELSKSQFFSPINATVFLTRLLRALNVSYQMSLSFPLKCLCHRISLAIIIFSVASANRLVAFLLQVKMQDETSKNANSAGPDVI